MEWRAGELNMRQWKWGTKLWQRWTRRDRAGSVEWENAGWVPGGKIDWHKGQGAGAKWEIVNYLVCVNTCMSICLSVYANPSMCVRVCVCLGSNGGADAACAPGLLLYGLLRKCCCANRSSHPQPITRLGPGWTRVNAYTQAHTYACSSRNTNTHTHTHTHRHTYTMECTHRNSIMRDKGNKWKVCVLVVILFIKVQGTVCACYQREAFGAHALSLTHTHTHTPTRSAA